MKIGILGAGLTGLTLAYSLEAEKPELADKPESVDKQNFEIEVLEKEPECGGLCRSIQEKGFTFDCVGIHIIFSKKKEPVQFILNQLGKNYLKKRRNNKIFFKGRFVKYPFENGLSDLPKEDNFECLYYYLNNNYPKPADLKGWFYYTFGKAITEKYLLPYNEKIWNYPPEKMSLHWVDGKVPKPPAEEIIKSAIGIETEGFTHQLYFYYPEKGGIQSLINSLKEKIKNKIETSFEIKKIKKQGDKWIVSNGKLQKEYDKLISTIPVFDLIDALENVPDNVQNAVNNLKYNSLISVMLGLDIKEADNIFPYTAVYFPDKDIKFHRISFPKNFSPNNVPEGKFSVLVEITSNQGDGTWELSDKELIDNVIEDLNRLKIIDKNKVCYNKVKRSKYAYVIYDLNYLENIKIIKDFMNQQNIILCGRFSEFEYLNMDDCIDRAINIAKNLS